MINFYVSENLNKVLTEKEYEDLIKREANEYGTSVNEQMENDTDYSLLEVPINVGSEMDFIELDNHLSESTGDNVLDNISVDELLENKSVSYKLTDSWSINIKFDIIDLWEDKLNSIIKITNIELI